ncbi:hypothetical protein [Nocardia sp. NPDC058480]|uniref:hypothetical protein n=1 Tax=Nocardia sp. NPDC058480 TaxID=3346522 RepID=UPI0036606692
MTDGSHAADIGEQTRDLMHRAARALASQGPTGWRRVDAVFALTVTAEIVLAVYTDDEQRVTRLRPCAEVLALIRTHRERSAQLGDGPWWRLTLGLTPSGHIEVDYDYGDDPFPVDHLFPPMAYQADLTAFPRTRLPCWLTAYLNHDDRQLRSAATAAVQARADRAADSAPVRADGLPPLPLLVARWGVLAGVAVAVGTTWGPRWQPSVARFDTSERHGSSLVQLDGRAVLSGGVWNAPALDAAYNADAPLPQLYDGAPAWVATPMLDRRAAAGLLSFCYWWEDGHWYQGESPAAETIAIALPNVWSAAATAHAVAALIDEDPSEQVRTAATTLVTAAEAGLVTRGTLVELFDDEGFFDIDGALFHLVLAGVTTSEGVAPMPRAEALDRVREHLLAANIDTTHYPSALLRADRLSMGWMVYLPVEPGEIAIGRAIYYVADDGVLERSSSSVAPSIYIDAFERRFQERHG